MRSPTLTLRFATQAFATGREHHRNGASDNALAVMQWVHAARPAGEDAVVSIAGHQCGDPQCAATTTILLMQPDQPALPIKISKPIEWVTEADVAAALQPLLSSAS